MAYIPGTNGNDDLYSGRNADHLDGGAGDDTLVGNGGDDTLEGGTGNDSLIGGDGTDTFVYANGDGNDTIADYEEGELIQIKSGTISKISTDSKTGNVTFKIGSGKIVVENAADKIITYEDPNGEKHLYPVNVNSAGTSVTLLAEYGKSEFNVTDYDDFSETVRNINASAVDHDLSITGNVKNNNIIAGQGDDTIDGGKGTDSLTGGAGADTFLWNTGDGNDKILDYANEDKIQINGTTIADFTKSGNNIILKLAGGNKISIIGGADKVISYIDDNGPAIYPENPIVVNEKKTAVTLKAEYSADTFDVTTYDDFGTTARTIDASAVDQDLSITGNAKNNVIIGADGNNTMNGGKGNDTLTGGTGSNVFVYANGGGNDVITNYKSGDVLQINGTVSSAGFNSNAPNDYVFNVGSGKITVKDARNKYIYVTDNTGSYWYPEIPSAAIVYSGGAVELTKKYVGDSFDVADFEDGFAGKVYSIDASAVQHGLSIIGNKEKNEIIGTEEDDYIDGKAGADKINGGDGDDTINGGTGNDVLTGGEGADVFVWNKGDGNDKIMDYASEDKISISGDSVTSIKTSTSNSNIILKLASGKNISVIGGKDNIISYVDDEGEHVYPEEPIIYNQKGTSATILDGYTEDSVDFSSNSKIVTIDASAVQHGLSITANKLANRITATEEDDYINGGAGKDSINGGDGDDTIVGGTSADSLTGGEGADTFVWNKGDGNDKILDYANEDNISISGATVKSVDKSGNDVILTIGTNKITVVGGADKTINYSDDAGSYFYPENPLTVNKNKTAVTLKSEFSANTFDVTTYADFGSTARTINASAVDQDLSITGNAKNNVIIGADGNNTIDGGKGNDTLTGGTGDNVFVYTNGGGNDVITNYKSGDILQINGTVSGAGFNDSAPDDYVFTVGKGKITVKNARNKYIYVTDNTGSYWYPESPEPYAVYSGGKVTIKKKYVGDTFDVADFEDGFAGTVYEIDASAVQHSLNITGNKQANKITGTGQKDYINGGAGADTIIGGAGNDSLVGGDGEDVFFWNKGDGNDKILDYEEDDLISVNGATVKNVATAKNGEDIIFTLTGSKKITVVGGADKLISYTDDANPEPITYPNVGDVIYNEDHTSATLTAGYNNTSFSSTDYSEYVSTLATIDASAVQHELSIYGSDLANKITGTEQDDYIDGGKGKDTLYGGDGDDELYGNAGNDKLFGGDGNDTLWGGAGTDTLTGDDGADTFIFYGTDGKNTITDFDSSVDAIVAMSGSVSFNNVVGDDVIFKIGSGQVTLKDSRTQYVEVVDTSGNRLAWRNGDRS